MIITRKCIVCGEEFEYDARRSRSRFAKKNKYPICCDECRKVTEGIKRSDIMSEYDIERMKQPPTLSDKMFIIDVLFDFDVFIDEVPDFNSTTALFRWKDTLIKNKLNVI